MSKRQRKFSSLDNDNVSTILLVDDSAVATKMASSLFQSYNITVISCESAEKGLELLKARCAEIDLVIIDVIMPQVNGVELLVWIKEDFELSHVPVCMLSGLEDSALSDLCIERGAEGVFLKPLDNAQVIKLLGETEGYASRHGHVVVGQAAPVFKLCDSNFSDVVLSPSSFGGIHVILAFVPSVFDPQLYDADGFFLQLFRQFCDVCSEFSSETFTFLCVTGDLPWSLNAAKSLFNIPFRLLADPTKKIFRQFFGSNSDRSSCLLHLDKRRIIREKWLFSAGHAFPDLSSWIRLRNEGDKDIDLAAESRREAYAAAAGGETREGLLADMAAAHVAAVPQTLISVVSPSPAAQAIVDNSPLQSQSAASSLPPLRAWRVFVVDDSGVAAAAACSQLEHRGHTAISVSSSRAIERLLSSQISDSDVVLLDILSPLHHGMSLLSTIKSMSVLRGLAVVVISVIDSKELREAAMGQGALGLITKPFQLDALFNLLPR